MIEFRQTLAARVVQQVAALSTPESRPETIRKLQERYHFMKVPTTFEEMFPANAAEGIQFRQGTLPHGVGRPSIIIEFLQLIPNIIIVQTKNSTDDAEEFLEDYINHANHDRSDTIKSLGPRMYGSEIEFSWDKNLNIYAPQFGDAAQRLNAVLASYGSKPPPYRVAAITVMLDANSNAGLAPGHFSIERRSGLPDSSGIFYSQAPLKTSDHIALLNSLDSD